MKKVNLYTYQTIKGPKRRNGVIGYLLEMKTQYGDGTLCNYEPIEDATENQAEIKAINQALKGLTEKVELTIYAESEFIRSAFGNDWIHTWQQSEWKNAKGKDIANKEEWQEMLILLNGNKCQIVARKDHEYRTWLRMEVEKEKKHV